MPRKSRGEIHSDDALIFFPTIGHFDSVARRWKLPIHGWIFKPQTDSLRRAAAVDMLRRWLGLERATVETALFHERLWAFLVNNQPHKAVQVRIGDQEFELVRSTSNGHIVDALHLPPELIEEALARQTESPAMSQAHERWLGFDVLMPPQDERRIGAWLHLLGEQGWSVISDIDDTIKITHVHDRAALLRQTFLREFEAVPGMAALYARWQAAGAAFHYVSRSPWQLYQPLAEFVAGHQFPAGTFHMRHFRWKNASTLKSDRTGAKKLAVIAEIIDALPQRHFVCVGDSGEYDPEIYGELARRHPEQVRAIYIRNVSGEVRGSERMQAAMARVPAERWQLFDDAAELPIEMPSSLA